MPYYPPSSSASAITIKDEGSSLSTAASSLDFVGTGVTASGSGADKTITIPGGSNQLASIAAASAAIANTETVVVSTSLAANYLTAGMSFRIRAAGVGTTGATAGADTFRIRIGSTTLTGNIPTSVAPTANDSVTAQPFSFEAIVTVRTTGATGTIIGECQALGDNATTGLFTTLNDLSATTATVVVDTTATKLLELTFQSGSAGSSCTFHTATIEVLSSGGTGSGGGLADQGTFTFLDGTVAAAPATPAAGKLRMYATTGKVLAVKDDAGVETVLGAGNENDAGALTNATSTGDAGNRADHFPGTSLDAAWVAEANALAAGPTVKYSAVGMRHTANNAHHRLRAYTPSGAFRIETRVRYVHSTSAGVGLFIRDSGTGDASGEAMLVWMSTGNAIEVYSLDAGTLTLRGSASVESGFESAWLYLSLARDGANSWTGAFSLDRALWVTVATHAKTFTVAKAGYRLFGGGTGVTFSADFFDVVS